MSSKKPIVKARDDFHYSAHRDEHIHYFGGSLPERFAHLQDGQKVCFAFKDGNKQRIKKMRFNISYPACDCCMNEVIMSKDPVSE